MSIYVYWIHYPHHTDPFTEGYVGISSNPTKRLKYHRSEKYSDNEILYRALNKGAIQSILHEFDDRKEALQEETNYRPNERIGWNLIAGGVCPPKQFGNKYSLGNHKPRHSREWKSTLSEKFKSAKWYNNGIKNIRCLPEDKPDGFIKGRVKSR